MKKNIFIFLILLSNIIYSSECKTNYDCLANQKCKNNKCYDNNFLFSSELGSQIDYMNKELEIYHFLDIAMTLYLSNRNDWSKISFDSKILFNKYFSGLEFLKFGIYWNYEIYFFDIHPYFEIKASFIYDFNKTFYISSDFAFGLLYSFSSIYQGLKLGAGSIISIYFSIKEKDIKPCISPNIFLRFEF